MSVIYNISYKDKKIERQIYAEVGKSIPIVQRFRMKGIGSQRFQIIQASFDIGNYLVENKLNFCNIELKSLGLILYFRYKNESYAFPIAYRKLSLYQNGQNISIYKGSSFVKLIPAQNKTLDSIFIKKIQDQKVRFTSDPYP